MEESITARLILAEKTARKVGAYLREQFSHSTHQVDERLAHDMKLRVDKESQALIAQALLGAYPQDAFLGEEGNAGPQGAEFEWIVDPLDGTVNFFYGLPLFCVSIALKYQGQLLLGCVYDPMRDECFLARRGGGAFCNGQPIRVSKRTEMSQAVVFVGHGRHDASGEEGLRRFAHISAQVCKMRILGTAALSLCYIAAGRMDAYLEHTLSLWDFAAAQVLLEEAGGCIEFTPYDAQGIRGGILAYNGLIPIHQTLAVTTSS